MHAGVRTHSRKASSWKHTQHMHFRKLAASGEKEKEIQLGERGLALLNRKIAKEKNGNVNIC